jgi:hypothetical protein
MLKQITAYRTTQIIKYTLQTMNTMQIQLPQIQLQLQIYKTTEIIQLWRRRGGWISIQAHRQQGDLMSLLIFFQKYAKHTVYCVVTSMLTHGRK